METAASLDDPFPTLVVGHGALLLTDSLVQDGVTWRLFSDTDHFRDVIVVIVSLLPALQPLPCQLSP